jgi:hypothetical protein
VGCDLEYCPYCGDPLAVCPCDGLGVGFVPADDRMPWAGELPAETACREFSWYARPVPGKGWVRCGAGEPGARADLIRLLGEARWDREEKRFVCVVKLPVPKQVFVRHA